MTLTPSRLDRNQRENQKTREPGVPTMHHEPPVRRSSTLRERLQPGNGRMSSDVAKAAPKTSNVFGTPLPSRLICFNVQPRFDLRNPRSIILGVLGVVRFGKNDKIGKIWNSGFLSIFRNAAHHAIATPRARSSPRRSTNHDIRLGTESAWPRSHCESRTSRL